MFGTSSKTQSVSQLISVARAPVALSKHIKTLGVAFDERLFFDKHVDSVCRGCYFHIRALRHVRSSMSRETADTVACAIARSRLGYCNSVLAGISGANVDRYQPIRNTLSRVVAGTPRRDHITPVLAGLHWPLVRALITFKVAILVYKIRETRQQTYLSEIVEVYKPTRTLCSFSANLLAVHTRQSAIGARSLRRTPSSVWNSLSDNIRLLN